MNVPVIIRLHYQALGLDRKYRHTNKENVQATKLQDFLDKQSVKININDWLQMTKQRRG